MIGRMFLGRYEVQRLLGEGGMGRVYLARQTDLGRQVVVKVMHDHVAQDAKFCERFQRETLLMARFHHPGAITLYDASLNDPSGPCIVMEYVKGVNLETLLARNGRMTALRVGRVVAQLCEVLQAAHDEGIIHRDLKPANLMIVEPDSPKERIKVMDFGLAKLIDDTPSQKVTDTNVDFAVGTPGYIAPEQVRGETMDHRGDLYSVGVMMFELLTGRLPFVGANSMDVLLAHATEAPPRFDDLVPEGWVPKSVQKIVYDVLAKNPDDRPQSARELGDRMSRALRQSQEQAEYGRNFAPVGAPSRTAAAVADHGRAAAGPEFVELEAEPPSASVAELLKPLGATTTEFQMEAWMPESIALRKLRGFVHDCDGEVVESTAGLIRVRLGKNRTPSASLSWFGFGKRSDGPFEMDLLLRRINARQDNKLSIAVHFRPAHAGTPDDEPRRRRCAKIFIELRAYLMGAPT